MFITENKLSFAMLTMKKNSEMKTMSRNKIKPHGSVPEKLSQTNTLTLFKRNSVSATLLNGFNSFEEVSRDITIPKTEKSFSYNISKTFSEEKAESGQNEKPGDSQKESDKAKLKNHGVNRYSACKQVNNVGVEPNLKSAVSDSCFEVPAQSKEHFYIKCSNRENTNFDDSCIRLSQSSADIAHVDDSESPPSSRMSSGSTKSYISQRSSISATSSISRNSLADKILESRKLMQSRDILHTQKSGPSDSYDSIPVMLATKRLSIKSEGYKEAGPSVSYLKQSDIAKSYPNVSANFPAGSENRTHSFLKETPSLQESRKHSPDCSPTEGENSVPIKPTRKSVRRVYEA